MFWFVRGFRQPSDAARRSAGAVATVFEDAFLEERGEVADVSFGEMEKAVFVCAEGRAGGRQHHPEQVPQITLQVVPPLGDHSLIPVSKQLLWWEIESGELWIF